MQLTMAGMSPSKKEPTLTKDALILLETPTRVQLVTYCFLPLTSKLSAPN